MPASPALATPAKPLYPFLPSRLLSSASAPALSPAASVPPFAVTESPVSVVTEPSVTIPMPPSSSTPNPEYREPWDKYWERTRPNKNRPYDRSHLSVPMPPREKGSTPLSCFIILG